ncbi:MAG TPA: OsmC family protein [Candidatus Limnocylindrales bacterium]|nr:OsmC family protein [Candidatus Limnocylindrales bacterium]
MSIAEAVEAASRYLTEHPDEARYRDSAARAHLGPGLVVEVTGPGGERLTTDMPKGIGGTGAAPSPGWMLRAAAASCVASLIGIRAAATQVELRSVDVEVDSESDDRGILGLEPSIRAGALSARIVVRIDAPSLDRAASESLVSWAVEHCPVTDTISRSVPLSTEVHRAGQDG